MGDGKPATRCLRRALTHARTDGHVENMLLEARRVGIEGIKTIKTKLPSYCNP